MQSIGVYVKIPFDYFYSLFVVTALFSSVYIACWLVADVTEASALLQLTVFHS